MPFMPTETSKPL